MRGGDGLIIAGPNYNGCGRGGGGEGEETLSFCDEISAAKLPYMGNCTTLLRQRYT